jgi:hypothetical protein
MVDRRDADRRRERFRERERRTLLQPASDDRHVLRRMRRFTTEIRRRWLLTRQSLQPRSQVVRYGRMYCPGALGSPANQEETRPGSPRGLAVRDDAALLIEHEQRPKLELGSERSRGRYALVSSNHRADTGMMPI